MTAALSAATPFEHERLEAAEIPPGSTWIEGIQTFHKGVLSDKAETMGVYYFDNQTRRGNWVFRKEGERTQVEAKTKDIEKVVEVELLTFPTQSITICGLHTHPVSAGETTDILSTIISAKKWQSIREGKYSISIPPSASDISQSWIYEWEAALKKFREKGVTAEARLGVVDAAGITYYREINEQDLRQEFPDYFAELQQRKAISDEWAETVTPLVDNLDTITVNQLHTQIPMPYERYVRLYEGLSLEQEKTAFKRQDIKEAIISGKWTEEIALPSIRFSEALAVPNILCSRRAICSKCGICRMA
jgi:hypothetical protein